MTTRDTARACDANRRAAPEKDLGAYVRRIFAERQPCGAPATFETPMGPRCDACAEDLRSAARSTQTPLGILLESKGIDPEEWIVTRMRPLARANAN